MKPKLSEISYGVMKKIEVLEIRIGIVKSGEYAGMVYVDTLRGSSISTDYIETSLEDALKAIQEGLELKKG